MDRITFPSGIEQLVDTALCPACFAALIGSDCPACGLDVRGGSAAELLRRSTDAADALRDRVRLIRALRNEALLARATVTSVPVAVAPASLHPIAASPSAAPPAMPPQAGMPSLPAPRARPRRRSSVQLVLLVVGVSLVTIAGIFFLTVAWIQNGLAFRSAIVAVATVVALLLASWLRRRSLTATAEGIGVVFVALVYLDAWAVQANGMFGADTPPALRYWGFALTASALLFIGWFLVARVRAGSVMGLGTIAIGPALLTADVASSSSSDVAVQFYVGSMTALVVSLLWVTTPWFAARAASETGLRAERVVLGAIGAAAAAVALLSGLLVSPSQPWAPALTLGLLAAVAGAHATALVRSADRRVIGTLVFGLIALLPPIAVAAVASRSENAVAATWVGILLPVAVSATAERLAAPRGGGLRAALVGIAGGSAVAAVVTSVIAMSVAATPLSDALLHGLPWLTYPYSTNLWMDEPWTVVDAPSTEAVAAVAALASAAALLSVFWSAVRSPAFRGLDTPRVLTLSWFAVIVSCLAIPLLSAPAAIVVCALGGAVIAAAVRRLAPLRRVFRWPLGAAAIGWSAIGYVVSFAEAWSWLAASVGVVAVMLLLRPRRVDHDVIARTLLLAGACGFAVVTALIAVGPVSVIVAQPVTDGRPVALAAAATLWALSALPLGRFATPRERDVTGLVAAFFGAVLVVALIVDPSDRRADVTIVVATVVATAAAVLWLLLPANRRARPAYERALLGRSVAAILLGPVLVGLTVAVLRLVSREFTVDATAIVITTSVAGILAAVAGLVSARREPRLRSGIDGGAAASLLVPFVMTGFSAGWILLLMAAGATLLFALSPDGLFRSRGMRRHLGWVALALATAAVWTRLSEWGQTTVEFYVLPVGVALLTIAILLWVRRPSDSARRDVAVVAFAGLIVMIAPLAVADTDSTLRSVTVGIVSALLVLLPFTLVDGGRGSIVRASMVAAGVVGVELTVVVHASQAGGILWIGVGFVVLAVGSFALGRHACEAAQTSLARASVLLLSASMALCGLLAVANADIGPAGLLTAFVVVAVSASIGATGFLIEKPPFLRTTGWTGYAVAGTAAVWTFVDGVADSFEVVTVPLACAILLHGWIALSRSRLGSWALLGPGLALLLIPGLIADLGVSPLWRIVGLGVVSLCVVLVGLRWRLQAPFLVGSVVLVAHATAQLWPWIRTSYEAVPWWAWLGLGGALLIVLAARYENRLRNMRSIVLRVSALR